MLRRKMLLLGCFIMGLGAAMPSAQADPWKDEGGHGRHGWHDDHGHGWREREWRRAEEQRREERHWAWERERREREWRRQAYEAGRPGIELRVVPASPWR